jgi:hypothetical protein
MAEPAPQTKRRQRHPRPPLWTCPDCGKQYVTRNTWHSCVVVPLESHFVNRPRARQMFDAYVAALERDGPITISVSKTRIEIMTRARFTGAVVRRDYLRASLWLKRRVDSPRFVKIEHFGGDDWGHYFEIRDESDIDDELMALAREARRVGDQEAG